jgi:hypothetical protein
MTSSRKQLCCLCTLLAGLAALILISPTAPLPAQQQDEAKPPPLAVEAIEIEPSDPAPDTLCKLRVRIGNGGDKIASSLGFQVKINGQVLKVYENQLFMEALAPRASSAIPLYNFWSTETSRPTPKDRKLTLEVTLREAQWMRIEQKENEEVWTPLGNVEGLPVSRQITLQMK